MTSATMASITDTYLKDTNDVCMVSKGLIFKWAGNIGHNVMLKRNEQHDDQASVADFKIQPSVHVQGFR
jgi:hypothetical protein